MIGSSCAAGKGPKAPCRPPSAAGHVHEANHLNIAVGGEVVTLGLEGHGVHDGPLEGVDIPGVCPQHMAQVHGVLVAQAEQQAPSTVTRTRLQVAQKLWLWGEMKPMRVSLSAMRK